MAIYLSAIILGSLALACLSCSHVRVSTADGVDVIGRTMELGGLGGELFGARTSASPDETPAYQVTVHARGESYSRSVCKSADPFTIRRGFVSVDLDMHFGVDNITGDGMNEDGLTISAHTLRQSVYQGEPRSRPVATTGEKICFGDLVPWALGNFRLVKDLTDALRHVSVIADTILPLPPGDRLHWAVEDATGDHVVLEYLHGVLQVHQNKVGVMTNDPDYTWHLRNLNNYAIVQETDPEPSEIHVETPEVGPVPSVVGHGFNLWGLPGDRSPPSRFVRLFYQKSVAVKNRGLPPTLSAGIKIVMGLLNDVWISKGIVALQKGDGPGQFEFTQYSLIKVPQKRLFHWRSYDNSQWHVIDLAHLRFDKRSSTPLDDGTSGIVDVTNRLLPELPVDAIVT